jgi:hypothetical protein
MTKATLYQTLLLLYLLLLLALQVVGLAAQLLLRLFVPLAVLPLLEPLRFVT